MSEKYAAAAQSLPLLGKPFIEADAGLTPGLDDVTGKSLPLLGKPFIEARR